MLLAFWVFALALGIAAAVLGAAAVGPPAFLVAGAAALAQRWVLGAAALAVASGAALGWAALRPPARPSRVTAALESGDAVAVTGTVRRAFASAGSQRVRVDVETIADHPSHEVVALSIRGSDPVVRPGDRVRFQARLSEPLGLANPGMPDARLLAAAQGVSLRASARAVAIMGGPVGYTWGRWAHDARVALAEALDRALPPPRAAFLRGLVLGERTAVSPQVEQGFRVAGATHALSVSGLHLTAVAGLIFLLLRRMLLLSSWLALRVRVEALAGAGAIPAVAFYTELTGAAVATERSALMAGALFAALILRRPFSGTAAIALAAAVLLLGSPLLVLDLSFQLSFASVIGLVLVAGSSLMPPVAAAAGWLSRFIGWTKRALIATTAAGLATTPLVAHHFAEITPAAPLGNLLLVPLVELGLVPVGIVGAAAGALHPVLGWLPLQVANALTAATLWIADLFLALVPVVTVRSPTAFETFALTAAVFLAIAATTSYGRRAFKRGAVAAALVASVSLGTRELMRRLTDDVRVTFLDVGQGDAILVEGPRGFAALIDGGGTVDGDFDPGARVIDPVLRRRGISRLDLVALSHPHPDHMNGLRHVLSRFAVGTLWTSGDDGGNPAYRQLLTLAQARDARAPVPQPWSHEGLYLQPLGPLHDGAIAPAPGLGVNDASLVLQLQYAGVRVLLTGDLEEEGEGELVGRSRDLRHEVLKVPHHGSRTSSTAELLDAVAPTLAVASLGRWNRFGFPHAEVVERFRSRGLRLLRTDLSGAITITIRRDGTWDTTCVRGCR